MNQDPIREFFAQRPSISIRSFLQQECKPAPGEKPLNYTVFIRYIRDGGSLPKRYGTALRPAMIKYGYQTPQEDAT